jgi:hypothetical protein
MCETAWYIHHVPVLGAEFSAKALAEGRGAGPQIEDRIPQRALDAAHDLYLGRLAQLIVHAAQRATVVAQGVVNLHKVGFEPRLAEFALTEESSEKAALVLALVEFDRIRARERGRDEAHAGLTPSRLRRRAVQHSD